MRETLLSFLDDCIARGEQTAVVHWRGLRISRWSYGRLASSAFQFARELEARGIGRGDRVLFWSENSPEWIVAFYGCLLRGAVVVPLDLKSAPDFAGRVQQQVSAKLLLADESQLTVPRLSLTNLADAIAHHPSHSYDATPSDLVQVVFTSGTTAEPKGVCLTHRNLLANIAPIEKEFSKYARWERLVHPLRFLCLLPLSHVFGQMMSIFIPELIGAEVYFRESYKPSEIITIVKKQRINVVVTVRRRRKPSLFAKLVDLPKHSSSFRLALLGLHHGWRDSGERHGKFLAPDRLCSHSRLRHDRDCITHESFASVSHTAWIDWKACSRTGSEAKRGRRDPRAWR
jgi:long-chain acyl-CoA synthetase